MEKSQVNTVVCWLTASSPNTHVAPRRGRRMTVLLITVLFEKKLMHILTQQTSTCKIITTCTYVSLPWHWEGWGIRTYWHYYMQRCMCIRALYRWSVQFQSNHRTPHGEAWRRGFHPSCVKFRHSSVSLDAIYILWNWSIATVTIESIGTYITILTWKY